MQLFDAQSCFGEITAYFNSEVSGYPFIANIDDSKVLQNVISKMQADSSKKIIKLSDYCNGDSLPNVHKFLSDAAKLKNGVVLGFLTHNMFQGEQALKQAIDKLLNMTVYGHVVVLIYGCSGMLRNVIHTDGNRAVHRTLLLETEHFSWPKITFTNIDKIDMHTKMIKGMPALLRILESFAYGYEGRNVPELLVSTSVSASIFKNSVIPVESINSIYDILCRNYPEMNVSTEQSWGTEKQWKNLLRKINKNGSLSAVLAKELSRTSNLSALIEDVFDDLNSEKAWYLWFAMKVFDTKENTYLSLAVRKSKSVKELIELIYMELLNYTYDESDFEQLYRERKRLIEKLPENLALIQKYCDHVGKYDRNAVYYLTNLSYKEKRTFLYYLGKEEYSYSEAEILSIVKNAFPELYDYLGEFEFNKQNTQNPTNDSALLSMLTKYFHDYKLQKVSNRIFPEFMTRVEENAVSRPFTKLLPRISVVNNINKTKAQIHFFDALGVEYLSYILKKCKAYGLKSLVHIAHCELPSITSKNLEFKKFFKVFLDENGEEILPGTKELDELKHHSKEIDYRKTREPVHLFIELEIIDNELKKIKEILVNHEFDKIIIISDHGASRLSVIHKSECKLHTLENRGNHSGRCCPVSDDPQIPEVAYENGFAVLANYDRFKGGRAANVEVHGGATLEETVVPIIEITLKLEEADVYIENKNIEFHNKETVSVIIHSNIVINNPKLIVKGISNTSFSCEHNCSSVIDATHYKFDIPEIKRTGKYIADFYDGDSLVQQGMIFEARKAVGIAKNLFS